MSKFFHYVQLRIHNFFSIIIISSLVLIFLFGISILGFRSASAASKLRSQITGTYTVSGPNNFVCSVPTTTLTTFTGVVVQACVLTSVVMTSEPTVNFGFIWKNEGPWYSPVVNTLPVVMRWNSGQLELLVQQSVTIRAGTSIYYYAL